MALLAGLKVVETAQQVAGPYCGKLLAAFGASVTKLEPPEGDEARRVGPFPDDAPDPESSGLFLYLNAGKQSMVHPTDRGELRTLVEELAADADLLVDDGRLESWGMTPEDLWRANPQLVVVRIHGLIPGTDASAWEWDDTIIYAESGWMASTGRPGSPPVHPGQDYPAYAAALYACFGAMGAVRHARTTGAGQVVDVSMLEAAISIGFYDTTGLSYGMPLRERAGHRLSGVAASVQPCGEGWVAMTVSEDGAWRRLCSLLDSPELAEGDFRTPRQRLEKMDALEPRLRDRLSRFSAHEITALAQGAHVAVAKVQDVADLYACEQLRARGWFVTLPHRRLGDVTMPGLPFRLSAASPVTRPAPELRPDDE